MTLLSRVKRRFLAEDGAATIPFVMFVPFMLLLVMSTMESGILMLRHVMLERAVDLTVRDLRLGYMVNPSHDQLKRAICNRAGIIPSCMQAMMVELRVVSMTTWNMPPAAISCIDRSTDITAPVPASGVDNDLMLIRVCTKFRPIFPMSGLGYQITDVAGTGDYALTSSSVFVNEPANGG